jgi:hypothetical protein
MSTKALGNLLIALGFLAGSWVATQSPDRMNWTMYVPAWLAAAIGVFLVRAGARQAAHAADALTTNIQTVRTSLERIVRNIDELDSQKGDINPHDARVRIDELFPQDLAAFADARESIAHKFGLAVYADIMNHFAAGERYINRVWSASVDGYVDECRAYIGYAHEQFHIAWDKLAAQQ